MGFKQVSDNLPFERVDALRGKIFNLSSIMF